jgi:uncharacterized membrane protein YeiH
MYLPSFPHVDQFSAGVNALNGVLVARNKSHERGFTLAGLIIMAFFGGIGGGVSRDVMLAEIPSPFHGSAYFLICLLMGLVGVGIYKFLESKEERFRTRTLAYIKSFSLPWFACLGAHKALDHGLGFFGAIMIGTIATNAGGVFIDVVSGVTPDLVMPSQQLVSASVLSAGIYAGIVLALGVNHAFFPVTLTAVGVGFTFRVLAVRDHWPSIVPCDPPAVPAAGK